MKRFFAVLLALIMCSSVLCSCGKYDKIPSSEQDMKEIARIRGYSVYYDELRCAVMNAKVRMAETYGINWNDPDSAEKHREELEERVLSGLKYNYAVQILFAENGYTIENDYVQNAVDQRMVELIDECGSRYAYIQYLEENFLTDRVLRFNIAIAIAVNELVYSLCDAGAFDGYGIDFDIEALTSSNPALYYPDDYQKAVSFLISEKVLLNSEHIYIPENISGGEQKANELLARAKSGEKLTDIAKEFTNGIVHEQFMQVEGERNRDYYNAVASLEHDDLTVLHIDSGWYVIRRLELDVQYVATNCFDLAYTYLSIKTNENLTAYEDNLEIEFTEYGKSLDLTKIQ